MSNIYLYIKILCVIVSNLSVLPILPYVPFYVTYISLCAENSKLLSFCGLWTSVKCYKIKLHATFSKRGARGDCLTHLTQYPSACVPQFENPVVVDSGVANHWILWIYPRAASC